LLRYALCRAGYPGDCLSQLQYGKYQRPYIDQVVDFNISHSGQYIVCAITHQGRVGIDVEKIKTINLSHFENYMTFQQWSDIMNSSNSLNRFFDYWTIKKGL
jgi:4'-phosphopantetheinyl transferase